MRPAQQHRRRRRFTERDITAASTYRPPAASTRAAAAILAPARRSSCPEIGPASGRDRLSPPPASAPRHGGNHQVRPATASAASSPVRTRRFSRPRAGMLSGPGT